MAKKRVLSRPEYDIDEHDDVDAIADAWRRRAIAGRKVSCEGLLASLAHVAREEDGAFDSVVIDPAFVDSFADRGWAAGRVLCAECGRHAQHRCARHARAGGISSRMGEGAESR